MAMSCDRPRWSWSGSRRVLDACGWYVTGVKSGSRGRSTKGVKDADVGVVADGHGAFDRGTDALAPRQVPWRESRLRGDVVARLEVGWPHGSHGTATR